MLYCHFQYLLLSYEMVFLRSDRLPWRNWLARSTVNRKVGGSSPPGSDDFYLKSSFRIFDKFYFKVIKTA